VTAPASCSTPGRARTPACAWCTTAQRPDYRRNALRPSPGAAGGGMDTDTSVTRAGWARCASWATEVGWLLPGAALPAPPGQGVRLADAGSTVLSGGPDRAQRFVECLRPTLVVVRRQLLGLPAAVATWAGPGTTTLAAAAGEQSLLRQGGATAAFGATTASG
jgi:hypothetical protein